LLKLKLSTRKQMGSWKGVIVLEHGEYVVGSNQQVLLFVGRGPWNDEALLEGAKKMGKQIALLDQTKLWAQLSCLVGESLMPPSTFNAFVHHSKIRKHKGLVCLAIVILHSEVANTIKQQLSEGYLAADIEHQFFSSIDNAVDWLAQKAFFLDQAQLDVFFQQCDFLHQNE
jgi:hypothetical protein